MAIVFDSLGEPLCHEKVVPGNTITSLNAEMRIYTEREVAYTSGGTTEIVVGDWVVGATSAAKAEVVSITLTSGTWAGGDAAGVIRVKNQHGTFQSENLKVAAGTNDATIAGNTHPYNGDYPHRGMVARSVLISVTGATALVAFDGGKPDQTALVGHSLANGSSLVLQDENGIRNFKCVDYTSGSASTLNVTYYF